MTDLILSTGERVPPLADTAVVHEDGGGWQLRRYVDARGMFTYSLGCTAASHKKTGGNVWWSRGSSAWKANYRARRVYIGPDLDEALAALWAARGA